MISFILRLWMCGLLLHSACAHPEGSNSIPKFYPQGYHLDLFPDLSSKLLKGTVCINIATYSEPSNVVELDADPSIVIHYKSIKVSEVQKSAPNTNQTVYEVKAVERVLFGLGTLKIHLSHKLRRDVTYKIHITFETVLKNDTYNHPFSQRDWVDVYTRTERKFVIMDLTNNECYKAFPCFNKLDYKCWVSLAVTRTPHYYALSTTPVINTTDMTSDGSLVKDHFQTTPPMSLNSLAFIVSDYRLINTLYFSGVMQSVYLNEKAHEDGDTYKLDLPNEVSPIVKVILKRIEDHIGISFPLPSFHVVLVPEKAYIPHINAFGLLIMNATNPDDAELGKNLVLDICRQWFVHVATPVSGNSTIYAVMSHLKNTIAQELFTSVGTSKFNYGQAMLMKLFRSPTTYSDSLEANSREIFETLAFNMLDRVFPGLVTEAISKFLRKKEFKMFSNVDIWDALNDVAKERNLHKSHSEVHDLQRITYSWKNAGFVPLVTVRRKYGATDRTNIIMVTQEPFTYTRFAFTDSKNKKKQAEYRAPLIPLMISPWDKFFASNQLLGWLSNNTFEFEAMNDSIVLMNRGHLAPFIVNYDDENWRRLAEVFDILPMDIQLQLLIDSLTLAKAGVLHYSVFLNMSAKIPIDSDHIELWRHYSWLAVSAAEKFHGNTRAKYNEFISRQVDFFFSKILEEKLEKKSKPFQKMIHQTKHRFSCLIDRSYCFSRSDYEELVYEGRMGRNLKGRCDCEIVKNVTLSDWEVIANGIFHALHNFLPRERSNSFYVLSCTENRIAFETSNSTEKAFQLNFEPPKFLSALLLVTMGDIMITALVQGCYMDTQQLLERYMNVLLLNFNKTNILLTEKDQLYVIKRMDNYHLRMLLDFVDKNFNLLKERLSKETWRTLMEGIVKSARSKGDLERLWTFYDTYFTQLGKVDEDLKNRIIAASKEIHWESEVFPSLEPLMDTLIKEFSKKFHLSWDKFPLNAM